MVKARVNTPSQKEAKRQHILAVAAHEFATYGFDVANINTIANLAGVGKGTMYRYAEDKEDLFRQVLAEAAIRIQAALDQAITDSEGLGIQERIRLIFVRLIALQAQYPDLIALQNSTIYGVMHRRFQGATVAMLQNLANQLEAIFAREVAAGNIKPIDARRMANFLTGQLHTFGRVTDLFVQPIGEPGEFMARLLWEGLKPDQP
jgi:AcrR family transcriptional regulator